MRHVAFRPAARNDLRNVARYLVKSSGSHAIGHAFVGELIAFCYRLARLRPGVGRPRPDLGEGMRSSPFKRYLVVFKYEGDTFIVVRIVSAYRLFEAKDFQP